MRTIGSDAGVDDEYLLVINIVVTLSRIRTKAKQDRPEGIIIVGSMELGLRYSHP